MADEHNALPLPPARCLNKSQAADYLGTGITLLVEIGPKPIKLGRRSVYDVIDLDTWLDEYTARGRARMEVLWPENKDSTNARTHRIGGSMWSSQTDAEDVKALGYDDGKTRKST
jgi:hypothetical protein